MPNFLSELLAVVAAFVLGGHPIDVPPYLNQELQNRGIEVSNLVKDFHSISPTPTPHLSEDEDNKNNSQDKVPAYNYSSDKEMPTTLPSNAVENSPSLGSNPPSEPTPEPTCIPYPPCLASQPRCMMPVSDDMCPPPPDPTDYPHPTIEPEPIISPYPCYPYDKFKYSPEMIVCLDSSY